LEKDQYMYFKIQIDIAPTSLHNIANEKLFR